ncbi:MAG: anti-sigma factor [Bryobacteraceae bacterium]|nr:anti-sigma factor [Bryobacteraceae bacterium]MDW8379656.1 anti-sigma factor [Bryobacterales bacterium]
MNSRDELSDLLELYALGLLEEPERSRVEELLQSASPELLARWKEALETNAILTAAVPLVEPPPSLRQRILASVGATQRAVWKWAWAALVAASLSLCVYWGEQARQRGQQLARLRADLESTLAQAARSNADLEQLRKLLGFLNAAETRVVSFGPQQRMPQGRVLLHPSRGVALIASNLPPAPAGRIYEMWLLKKGQAVPAGLFQSSSDGTAIHIHLTPVPLDVKIAVTVEPESGSPEPTSTPLFIAGL